MRKFVAAVLAVLLIAALCACGSPAFQFDKTAAITTAESAVEVIDTRDYDAIVKLFREDLQSQTSADSIKTAWDSQLAAAGDFVGYKSETATAVTQSGTDYIVVVLTAEYQNSTLTYTISLDTDMNVAGMYMK
jgi:outer membrane lipopolysaccharide assembly protein LptE/RlpB